MTTIKDVAHRAKVSLITVSRVVNGEAGVSEATRARVLNAIEELGYTPHLSAQRLRRGKSEILALLLPRIDSPYAVKLLRSVLDEARSQNHFVLILEADLENTTEREYIQRAMVNNRVDGVLIAPPGGDNEQVLEFLAQNKMAYVAITPNSLDRHTLAVEATDREGALEATRYLISMGHQRIAHISCLECERFSRERLEGYMAAFAEAGCDVASDLIIHGDNSTRSGYTSALELLDLPDPPTAIFAGNDEMAIGVTMALWHQGLSIPDDISVIGFDDAPIVQQVFPFLTTVYQPIEQIAQTSVAMLTNAQIHASHVRVPTRLVIRHSCAPPRRHTLVRHSMRLSPIDINFDFKGD